MKWLAKAVVQNALSRLPRAERANYLFQRRIAGSLPASDAAFLRKARAAIRHYQAFVKHGTTSAESAVFYEFGTGWDLVIPLAYYALGVNRQILVDIRPNLQLELVLDTLRKYERLQPALEEEAGVDLRPLPASDVSSSDDLELRFGIRYLAPCDARGTGLPPESVDFISSTDTLEHIPEADVRTILEECARIVRAGGILSSRIDLRDHYAYFDAAISPYNYLRFSDRTWSLVNSPLHFQNRMRYPDYLRLLEHAGLQVVAQAVAQPTDRDLETLRTMKLAERFRDRYTLGELGGKSLNVVARRPA